VDLAHHLVEPVLRLDQLAGAAAQAGQPAQERGVDRLVDAEREHPQPRQLAAERREDLILVADLAVGDQHDHLVAGGIGAQQRRRPAQRLGQLGAAARVDAGQELHRVEAIAIGRWHQLAAVLARQLAVVVERDHRDAIARGQAVDDARRGAPGRHHLPALHRARAIEHDDDVARAPAGGAADRRHHGHRERAGRAGGVGGPHRARRQRRAAELPAQHHVAVEALARAQLELPAAADRARVELAEVGAQAGDRQAAAVDAEPHAQPHRARHAGQQHRRRDPRRVGHRVGVRGDAEAGLLAGQRRARDVARRDHQREHPGHLAVVDRHRPRQRQRDRNDLAGHDVADPQREHAGAILLGDRRALAAGDGLIVAGPRGAALVEHALDDALAGDHAEALHRGPVGQREHVGGLDRLAQVVDEGLAHLGGRGQPDHPRVDVDGGQRQASGGGVEGAPAAVAAGVGELGFDGDGDHGEASGGVTR
jgi:hypothetical protein